jgi:phosphoribosyl 1,2-cyclic phosphodiesterase
MAIRYELISSGSEGNAVVVNDFVLIDCGVSFKALKPYYKALKIVLLTHIHSDHFNKTAIRLLARERPTLRFVCGAWLAESLVDCKVEKSQIDVVEFNKKYLYGLCDIIPIPLVHDVPNCGYKVHFPKGNGYERLIYATDTNCLNGITANGYDLFMIEANHVEAEINQKIEDKKDDGEFAYEKRAKQYHLSKDKADNFICTNIGANGQYVYLHCHKDKEEDDV